MAGTPRWRSTELLAGCNRMPSEELRGGKTFATFALKLQNPQRIFSAADDDAVLVGGQDFPCPPAGFDDFSFQNF